METATTWAIWLIIIYCASTLLSAFILHKGVRFLIEKKFIDLEAVQVREDQMARFVRILAKIPIFNTLFVIVILAIFLFGIFQRAIDAIHGRN